MWRLLRRIVVTVVGFGFLALGVVLLALPGPGILVSVVGFAVLATEYVWAQRALAAARDRAARASAATVAQPWRIAATLTACALLLVLGVVLVKVRQPFGSVAPGYGLIVGAVIATATTIFSLQQARGGLRRVGHGRQGVARAELPPGAASPWSHLQDMRGRLRSSRGRVGGGRRAATGQEVAPSGPAPAPAEVARPAAEREPPVEPDATDRRPGDNVPGGASTRTAGRPTEEAPR